MKRKRILPLVLVLILALVTIMAAVAGCQPKQAAAPTDNSNPKLVPGDEGKVRRTYSPDDQYIYVGCMWNLEYFNAHKLGMEYAGKALGVKTSVMGPAEYDIPAMVNAFEQAIAMKPAGIVTFAVDPEIIPEINKAMDAGIPVVTVCGDQPDSKRLTFVGTNQYEVGLYGGQKLSGILNGKGKVAILTIPGTAMFDDREKGYRDGMKGLTVVAVGDTKADIPTGINVAKSLLAAHPDLDAFVCTDSVGAISAATAVKEANLAGKVKIIGMDRNNDVLQLIKDGVVTATVAQNDALMPFLAVSLLTQYNYNHVPITMDNKAASVPAMPQYVYTGQIWIDSSNAQYFMMGGNQ